MNTVREWLFGAVALQRRSVDVGRLRQAIAGRDDGQTLGGHLVDRGWLTPEVCAEIDAEVERRFARFQDDLEVPLDEIAQLMASPEESVADLPPTEGGTSPPTELPPFDTPTVTLDPGSPTQQTPQNASDQPTVTMDFVLPSRPGEPRGGEPLDPTQSLGHVRLTTLAEPPESAGSRYSVTQLHALGGIGQVWIAQDLALGREVALKELKGEQISRTAWARFLHEARVTGQLEHPGIVPVYELSSREGDRRPFYTMRFIRGDTLREAVRTYHEARAAGFAGPLELMGLIEAFLSICHTMAYAHARGVLHRDLKSQNVVIGPFGDVVVLDWGLAKLVGEAEPAEPGTVPLDLGADPMATLPGQVLGTPAYMAPEQAEGRLDRIGRHTDVYGLGAILYEILAGHPPFGREAMTEMLRKVREEAPQPPRKLNPAAPPALEAICLKALAKVPEDRYASASDLADDVRRWLADEPVSAYPDPWTKRLARWGRRHRTAAATAAVLLLSLTAALGVGYALVRRERDEATAQREFARRAVRDMYTEVAEDWLEYHLDLKQRQFLQSALAYYEDFAARDAGSPEVRRETALARARVGDIQRKLGHAAEAERAYRGALEIQDRLADGGAATRARLAALLVTQNRLDEAGPLLDDAGAALERVVAAEPAPPADRFALARVESTRGELLRLERRNDGALAALRRAAEVLEPLATGPSPAIEHRREWARVLDSLGVLLSEVDQPAEARAALERAAGVQEELLAQFPTVPRLREDLAKTCNSLGLLLRRGGERAAAEAYLRRALRHNQRLAEDFPDRPEYRRTLGRGQVNLGLWLQDDGRLDAAEVAFEDAVASFERLVEVVPSEARPRRDLAIALLNLGSVHEMQDRVDDARATYERSRARYAELVERHPDVPDYRDGLADALLNLGRVLELTEGPEPAAARLAEARTLLEGLVATHPEMASYRASLARCLATTGPLLSQADPEAGRAASRAAVEAFGGLVDEAPESLTYQLGLADALANLATLVDGDAEKEPLNRRALAAYDELVEAAPQAREKRAVVLNNLGELLARTDRATEAADRFAQAADAFRALAEAPGAGPTAHAMFAYVLAKQGQLAIEAGSVEAAQAYLERAVDEQRRAARTGRSPAYQLALQDQLESLSRAVMLAGRHDEAARLAAEISEVLPEEPETRLRAARLLAGCVALAEADANLPDDRRDTLARSYGARAVAQLRVGVDSGLAIAEFVEDLDLSPIRDRDDFQALLADARSASPPGPVTE